MSCGRGSVFGVSLGSFDCLQDAAEEKGDGREEKEGEAPTERKRDLQAVVEDQSEDGTRS